MLYEVAIPEPVDAARLKIPPGSAWKGARVEDCSAQAVRRLGDTTNHIKAIGKSSSRKSRRVIYYILYRTDPQKTH